MGWGGGGCVRVLQRGFTRVLKRGGSIAGPIHLIQNLLAFKGVQVQAALGVSLSYQLS